MAEPSDMTRSFSADDAWHLAAGTHTRLWDVLGALPDEDGTTFRVWAPNASAVSVVAVSLKKKAGVDTLEPDTSGVWRGTFDSYAIGDRYKYAITSGDGVHHVAKADPLAHATEMPPATASVIAVPSHDWGDADWMATRAENNRHDAPMSTYEVHLGSWRFEPGGYVAIATQLAEYCTDMGFTHVELMPVTEHPFYGSWGYQATGYFAPTARYGSPEDMMALVDILHQAGIGVILDWVPSHFPTDEFALGYFDGTHLYEHADPKQGFHPDWKSFVFNYGRGEVRSFLLSSAHYWLDQFHIDGLRVDAVASMLYLDYSREDGEWIPNEHGGNENLESIAFLQQLNTSMYAAFPDIVMVAEESTAWPGVTNPTDADGLGFGLKWDMGWMNDTLDYMSNDPIHRRWHHDRITFRSVYAAAESYVLPLSHDEVVHGKGSLVTKMPGDRWQQFANLRLLFGYQWNHEAELAWPLLQDPLHAGVQGWVRKLNELYSTVPALHQVDRDPSGFQWVVNDDSDQSVLAYLRHSADGDSVLVVMNNTPEPRSGYQLGVPELGDWRLLANSDDEGYGGSAMTPGGSISALDDASHGLPASIQLDLPPLAILILQPE